MTTPDPLPEPGTLDLLQAVDTLCDRFEQAWQAGSRPDLGAWLPASAALRRAALVELVLIDLEHRCRLGEPARAHEYFTRFPELADDPDSMRRLTDAEHRLAAARGPQQSLGRSTARDGAPRTADDPSAWPEVPGYEILGLLGRGGMGVVYRARQIGLNRVVALKMIRDAALAGPVARARFRREAEAVARLTHPHVVQIHDIGECDGQPYFALEYCGGGSLSALLHGSPLPAPEAATVIQTLARAVQAAHEVGIVHRDLKPANVLLQPVSPAANSATAQADDSAGAAWRDPAKASVRDFLLKIADFGLAKTLADGDATAQTASGAIVGTPSYMAPEQAGGASRGKRPAAAVGPAADIYALGAVLYELLTGRAPFRAASVWDTLHLVMHQDPVPPSRLNANTPRDLNTICLKCLAKEPGRRYVSARALADDLERFLRGEPIVARPVGRVERAVKWARRNKAAAAFLVAVALLIFGSGAAALWYQGEQARQTQERLTRVGAAERQRLLTEQSIRNALDQAEKPRRELHALLATGGGVFRLLNDSARWEGYVRNATASLRGAEDLLANARAAEAPEAGEATDGTDPALAERAARLTELLRRDESDRVLAEKIEKIRAERATIVDNHFDFHGASAHYRDVFTQLDHGILSDSPAAVAHRLAGSPIHEQLLAALDEWAFVAAIENERALVDRLLEIGRRAAPDPAWGDRVRRAEIWRNQQALSDLVKDAPIDTLSPTLLNLVGNLLVEGNPAWIPWRRQAQARYPADYWLNYDLGNALYKIDAAEAAGFFRAALALRPNAAAAYNNLGVTLYLQKKHLEAVAALERAVALDPHFASAYNNLGNPLCDLNRLDAAVAACRKAIALRPNFADAHFNLGIALRRQHQLEDAAAAYRQAIHFRRKYTPAYIGLGNVLHDLRKPDEAIAAYRKAIELKPDSAEALTNLGIVLHAQKKLDEAEAAHRSAIAARPRAAVAYNNLAGVLRDRKKLDEAEAACRKAIELQPDFAEAYSSLGNTLRDQKKLDEAATACRKAVTLKPDFAIGHCNLGNVLHDQGKFDEAAAACRKAIALKPDYADAYYNLGNALRQLKKLDDAVAAYRRAVAIRPNFAVARNNLAITLISLRKLDDAVAALQQAIDVRPRHPDAHVLLGFAHMQKNEYKEAVAALTRGVALMPPSDPRRQQAVQWLGQAQKSVALEARLAAVLAGNQQLASPAEALELAYACVVRSRFAAAARLHRDAFMADPTLADQMPGGKRHLAAGCAALASCGQGRDAGDLPESERVQRRRQALAWLRADLAWWRKALDDEKSAAGVAQRMRDWQKSGDFSGLRDPDALAILPTEERSAWLQFWADVESLRQQAALHQRADRP